MKDPKMKLPEFLKKYFWEVNFKELDLKKNPEYITLRLLEYGDILALRWLFHNLPREKIRKIIINHQRMLSPKSLNFWALFFNINAKKLSCLKRSYLKRQKIHWPY